MKKDTKQRLFEVMERVDPSFTSVRDGYEYDKIFTPEELKRLENADNDDLETFNQTMDSESPHYDPFGYFRHDELEYEMEKIFKEKGQQPDEKYIRDLASEFHDFLL